MIFHALTISSHWKTDIVFNHITHVVSEKQCGLGENIVGNKYTQVAVCFVNNDYEHSIGFTFKNIRTWFKWCSMDFLNSGLALPHYKIIITTILCCQRRPQIPPCSVPWRLAWSLQPVLFWTYSSISQPNLAPSTDFPLHIQLNSKSYSFHCVDSRSRLQVISAKVQKSSVVYFCKLTSSGITVPSPTAPSALFLHMLFLWDLYTITICCKSLTTKMLVLHPFMLFLLWDNQSLSLLHTAGITPPQNEVQHFHCFSIWRCKLMFLKKVC